MWLPFLLLSFTFLASDAFEVESSWWSERTYHGMPVDHFSYNNNKTFGMRYLINQSNWSPGNPILFYCGNEGDITLFALNTGFMWEIAPEFKGMVVFAEHRYYGKTQPFGADSYKRGNLGFLTSEQALADYAIFLTWLKGNVTGAGDSPVIAFGGSYGGMLAAWFRVKYPHIVIGSLASSAPILQFNGVTPCNTFSDIVTRTFRNSGSHCADNIKASWAAIRRKAQTAAGKEWLNANFNLCPNSTVNTESDVQSLISFIHGAYDYMAMIDYPYPTNFLNPVPAWPVQVACSKIANANYTDEALLLGIMNAISVYLNYEKQVSCFSFNYSATSSLGTEGWNFQACTEMVMPMCDGADSMYEPSPWSFAEFSKGCQAEFGVSPRLNWAMTNYGGRHLSAASNIIFSNGLLDPWSGGSPLLVQPYHRHNLAIFNITLGAHHLDLRSSNPGDPPQLRLVRNKEKHLFRAWLEEHAAYKEEDGTTEQTLLSLPNLRFKHLHSKAQLPFPPKPVRATEVFGSLAHA